MSNILYDMEHEQTDEFAFKINRGGEYQINESGTVEITFRNGEFQSVRYPLAGTYTRNGWRILAAIEDKISRIERTYFGEK